MKEPLVTICITAYNRERLLPKTVKSVLAQTYPNTEIIIVDDHSQDKTWEVIKSIKKKHPKIHIMRHQKNKGLSAARNTAIKKAKGKYFTFIDDDDQWKKNYIDSFVQVAKKYDEKWCFCCGNTYKNPRGRIVHTVPKMEGRLDHYLMQGYTPPVAGQFYHTEQIKAVSGYTEEVRSGVDLDLWIKLAVNEAYIKGVPKSLSLPNTDTDTHRMTTDINRRVKGVQEALAIWKKILIDHFGAQFFQQYSKSLLYYTTRKVISNQLRQGNIKNAVKLFIKTKNKTRIISDFAAFFFQETCTHARRGQRQKIITPTLQPYKKAR